MRTRADISDAQRFWIDFHHGSGLAFYVIARMAQHAKRHRGEALDRQINELLQRLDYSATITEVMEAYQSAARDVAEFWAGRYGLFDPISGDGYELYIGADEITLHVDDRAITDTVNRCFANGHVTLGDDRYQLQLVLEVPPGDARTRNTAGQPRCRGRLIGERNRGRGVDVVGKRGCYTLAGARRVEDGDPIEFWAGEYQVLLGDKWHDQRLHLYSRNGETRVKLQTTRATDVAFINNRLICNLGDRQLRAELMVIGGRIQLSGALFGRDTRTEFTGFRIAGGV